MQTQNESDPRLAHSPAHRCADHSTDDLFNAELLDLRGEIMSKGVLLPLIVLGYIGIFMAYQKPFIMAMSTLMTLPMIVLFFVAQRYFIGGITLTGINR
jgi:hypothetical protein